MRVVFPVVVHLDNEHEEDIWHSQTYVLNVLIRGLEVYFMHLVAFYLPEETSAGETLIAISEVKTSTPLCPFGIIIK